MIKTLNGWFGLHWALTRDTEKANSDFTKPQALGVKFNSGNVPCRKRGLLPPSDSLTLSGQTGAHGAAARRTPHTLHFPYSPRPTGSRPPNRGIGTFRRPAPTDNFTRQMSGCRLVTMQNGAWEGAAPPAPLPAHRPSIATERPMPTPTPTSKAHGETRPFHGLFYRE